MQASPPQVSLGRPHLDSATYRAVLRILSHCVELEPRISPSPPRFPSLHPEAGSITVGSGERERLGSSEDAADACGTPGEDRRVLDERRDSNGGQGHGEVPGGGFPEDGDEGLGKMSDDLGSGCPRPVGAQVENSLLVRGLGAREEAEEVYDDSRDGLSQKERPCGSSIFLDSFVDFSYLMEELEPQKTEEQREEHRSDGAKDKLSLEYDESLGGGEPCRLVDAPEHIEKSQDGTRVAESLGDELLSVPSENARLGEESCIEALLKFCELSAPSSFGSEGPEMLPMPFASARSSAESCMETQLKICDPSGPSTYGYEDPEMASMPSENARLSEESCIDMQLKSGDPSRPSRYGSGPSELYDHQKIISTCMVEDDEMEEGEIPNEGGTLDFSFDLEFQDAANERIQLEQTNIADISAEKGNITHTFGGFIAKGVSASANFIKEKVIGSVHVSDHVAKVGMKPQKKKKSHKETKKAVGKLSKKVDKSNKLLNVEMELEPQKKAKAAAITKGTVSGNAVSASLTLAEMSIKEFTIQSEEKQSDMKDANAQQKRKRGPLTESRKEKKKLAKKRKRAETNRKAGVKRLKLEMSSKPRKVVPCSFYQKGRCQKGDSCKFSHDLIPDTKSMPCTFFARGTCLKGSDCPFDHQLSKYPCHNFVSQGKCNRGEDCLFSHKIPIGEPSSTASMISETSSTVLSGKQRLLKCLNLSNLATSAVNVSLKTTTPSEESSIPKDLEQIKLKQPVRMPKGMCFLSFGKEPSIGINKQDHDLDLKKGGDIQMPKQEEKIILGKPQNSSDILPTSVGKVLPCGTLTSFMCENKSLSLAQKPPILVQQNVEIKSGESVQPLGPNTTSSDGAKDIISEESRVTDACRILEEFLFSGIA